jgi:hypothetical protein
VVIEEADVVLVKGILIFYRQEIRELLDIKLFVDYDSDARLSQRGMHARSQPGFNARVIPLRAPRQCFGTWRKAVRWTTFWASTSPFPKLALRTTPCRYPARVRRRRDVVRASPSTNGLRTALADEKIR